MHNDNYGKCIFYVAAAAVVGVMFVAFPASISTLPFVVLAPLGVLAFGALATE